MLLLKYFEISSFPVGYFSSVQILHLSEAVQWSLVQSADIRNVTTFTNEIGVKFSGLG